MLWKSDRPASMHCYTAATFSKTSHTVGRQHALTWRLTSIEKTAATSYCWIHWQGFPTFVRAFVCVYQSKQYTYLFVQTWVLSQQPHNALSILCPSLSSLSPPSSHSFSLTLCLPHTVSPSLSRSLALSLSLCGSTALSSQLSLFSAPPFTYTRFIRRSRASLLPLNPLPSFTGAFSLPSVCPLSFTVFLSIDVIVFVIFPQCVCVCVWLLIFCLSFLISSTSLALLLSYPCAFLKSFSFSL